jgi:AcrR family transcriptional regulator
MFPPVCSGHYTKTVSVVVATVKPVGYKHSYEEVIDAAVAVVLSGGFNALTYKAVATELGISDRMVVYYLPTKTDLITAVVASMSEGTQQVLERAFGHSRRSADELVRKAWPVLKSTDADRKMALFLEVIGLSAAKIAPYDQVSRAILDSWVQWLTNLVDEPTERARRSAALGIIARVDGLLLLRHALGEKAADEGARSLGI